MTTPTPKATAEMSTFSYAQAAKGLVSTPVSSNFEKQGQSTAPPSEKQFAEANGGSDVHEDSNETPSFTDRSMDTTEKQKTKPEPESSENIPSAVSSPSVATASTETFPKEDDMSLTPNGSSDSSWDKQSQVSVSNEKFSKNEEDTKESSENGTEKDQAPARELKEAPIPAVNIWQQRREAQEAKARANAPVKSTTPATKSAVSKTSGAQSTSDGRSDASRTANRRKSSESFAEKKKAGDASKKGTMRSHRPATDSESAESIPSMADASSWPTPEVARGEEQRRAQEKTDRTEKVEKDKPASSRSHGKEKWMPVPYVPTAVFSTPLPPAARRGGRIARGSREGGTHATSHAHGGERTSAGSNTGSGSKNAPASDRRATTDSKSAPGGKQNGVDAPFDGKYSQSDEGRDAKDMNKGYPEINSGAPESSTQQRHDSKSTGRLQESANPIYTHPSRQGGPHGDGNSRFNAEKRFENGPRSADPSKESATLPIRDRDYQRNDFHREREYTRENRGESRPERGRGGYRGRGGHSTYAGAQNGPFHTAPIPQHPFATPKNFSFNNERHRMQQSQNGSQNNARMGLRSPSMPNPAMYGPTPYPIQTDLTSVYGYPQMHQGPMSAVPYQPYMEQYSLMNMISMQLEYYFSVDNLCKDMFLRKHMDSQGFVLLSVIAAFKRIKSLTEDMDLLRLVCRQLKNVEYRPGEDGLDRVRKREKWEQWVLSMEMRDLSAQHEGPPPLAISPSTNFDGPIENGMTLQQDGYTPLSNGTAHVAAASLPRSNVLSDTTNFYAPARSAKLSSTAPEFSPQVPPMVQNENVSERNPVAENVFPDRQIENLVIVVRKPGFPSPTQSPILGPSSRSFSNEFVNGDKAARWQLIAENRSPFASRAVSPGLDSTDMDKRIKTRNISNPFSFRKSPEPAYANMPTFRIKDESAPIESFSTDLVHKSYTVFRKQALDKRLSSSPGETPVDMDVLYQFWFHFLVRNFNSRMYNEFRSLALDDVSSRDSTSGLQYLIKFYDGVLLSKDVIGDGVARDFVELVKSETGANERPAFSRLRYAWRNGAFNLKSRKKIDSLIDETLRADLDR